MLPGPTNELPAPRLLCKEVVELLSDYVDGTLPAGERARVDAHLQTCPECIAYLQQLRATIGVLGRLRAEDIPSALLGRIASALRGWRGHGE